METITTERARTHYLTSLQPNKIVEFEQDCLLLVEDHISVCNKGNDDVYTYVGLLYSKKKVLWRIYKVIEKQRLIHCLIDDQKPFQLSAWEFAGERSQMFESLDETSQFYLGILAERFFFIIIDGWQWIRQKGIG